MSTANSFSLLEGDDSGWSQPSKNKKKSKKKVSAAVEQSPAPVAQSDVIVQDAMATEEVEEFQVVKRGKLPKASGHTGSNGRGPIDAASLEKAAMEATAEARSALLKEWQVRAANETLFREELIRSQALERLVKGLASVAFAEDASPLASLLTAIAHPSLPTGFPKAVAELVVASGSLSPADPLAPGSQAAAAGAASVAVIKRGFPLQDAAASRAGGLAALQSVQTRLESLEASLEKTTTAKEQARIALQLVEAAREAADLGNTDTGAAAFPDAAAALSSLDSLRSALAARHKVLDQTDEGSTVEEQIAVAQRTHAREDATLAAEEKEADAQVVELERQLVAARAAAQEIKARRATGNQLLQRTVQGLQQGSKASAAAAAKMAAGVEAALGHADSVNTALQTAVAGATSQGDVKAVSKAWVECRIPARFAEATQQHLEAAAKYLKELGSKSAFYRERLEASSRQGEHLALLKERAAVAEHKKQRKGLETLLNDALSAAAAVEVSAQTTLEAWRTRQNKLRRQAGASALPAGASHRIDALARDIAELADDIASGRTVQEPVPSGKASRGGTATASVSEVSGRTTPGGASAAPSEDTSLKASEMAVLEQRLAALEEENKKKDAQIAAMMAAAAIEISSPSPTPAKKAWSGGKA